MKFYSPPSLLACAAALSLLAGCGQMGPLHLPQDAPSKEGYLLKKRKEQPAVTTEPPAPSDSPIVTPPASPGIEPR